jgi:hypothetical protein
MKAVIKAVIKAVMKAVMKADLTAAVVIMVVAMQVGFLALVVSKLVELVSVLPVAATAAAAIGLSCLDSTAAVVVAMGSAIGDSRGEEVEE